MSDILVQVNPANNISYFVTWTACT